LEEIFQKERISRTLIRLYQIYQDRSSAKSFKEVCDRYILANIEVFEREKQLFDIINEIQMEYQDWGAEQFMSKYDTK